MCLFPDVLKISTRLVTVSILQLHIYDTLKVYVLRKVEIIRIIRIFGPEYHSNNSAFENEYAHPLFLKFRKDA